MGNWLSRFDRRARVPSDLNTPWFNRRVFMLSRHLAAAIPGRGTVLMVGAGDGRIARALMRLRPDLHVEGADIDPPPHTLVPVARDEGTALPWTDKNFDYAVLVDALSGFADPSAMLAEAGRVAREGVVVKDHQREGWLAGPTLRLIARSGDGGGGFLSRREWEGAFFKARLELLSSVDRLDLHLPPGRWLFDRRLHFVAYLTPKGG